MSKFRQLRNKNLSAMAALTLTASIIVPAGAQLIPLKADAGQQLGQTNFDEGVGLPWHIVESAPAEMEFEELLPAVRTDGTVSSATEV